MKIKFELLLDKPAPKKVSPHYKRETFEDRARRCMTKVSSNREESETEWKYLKKLYEILSKKPNLSDSQMELIDELEEMMMKYGQHDHSDAVELDAQNMNRGKKTDG